MITHYIKIIRPSPAALAIVILIIAPINKVNSLGGRDRTRVTKAVVIV